MKKISYKTIAVIILIFSIVMLGIFLKAPLTNYMKTIGISISINLISSVIIIFLIDFKMADDEYIELEEKRKILYRQLIVPIRQFDSFILHLYKSVVNFEEMKEFKFNIENVDKIIEKIGLIDNTKASYIRNNDLSVQTWKWAMIIQPMGFVESVEKFYASNSYILPNNLSENIDNILKVGLNVRLANMMLTYDIDAKTEDIIEIFDYKNLLISSFKLKEEILRYYDENPFEIYDKNLLREDVSPRFESGLKD